MKKRVVEASHTFVSYEIGIILYSSHQYSNLYFDSESRVSFPLRWFGRAGEDGALALLGSTAPSDARDSHRHTDRLP